jgi:hypothetical protein
MTSRVGEEIVRALDARGGYFQKYDGKMTTTFVDPNNPAAVAKAKADIKERHAEAARKNAKSKNPWAARNNTRVCEFEAIYRHRMAITCPMMTRVSHACLCSWTVPLKSSNSCTLPMPFVGSEGLAR